MKKRGQREPQGASGERRVPRSPARQAERSGLGPQQGQQAERRSDPRASEGVLVNWVFAPSGAQGAGLRFFSGGCADGELSRPKDVSGETAGSGIVAS